MKTSPLAILVLAGTLAAGGARAQTFTVSSPDFSEGGTIASTQVYKGFGCTGDNISPELNWSGAPAGTKSFAVTDYDPDAPTGSGWWHWLVVNIPPSVTKLPKNAGNPAAKLAPKTSIQTRTDFGTAGYGGPCPPKGDSPHHYIFTVYALDTDKLPVNVNSSAAFVGFNLHFHTLGKATMTGTYGR
jgi:Raf kinase inhibitor-like YbhB/YbcL family protein